MKDHVFPVFAAFGSFLPLLPILWHWRTRNYAMIMLMVWIALSNFVLFMNAVVWFNTVRIMVPVWCDISIKIFTMGNIAIPAGTLCVTRKLESIAATRCVNATAADKRRERYFEFGMCLGLPIIYAILSVVYQGHRFDIYEGMGCLQHVYPSWPWIAFGIVPLLLVCVTSLTYSLLALRWFIIRRRQFIAILTNSGTNIDKTRYLRMMTFCVVDLLVTMPMIIANLTMAMIQLGGQLYPYHSWDEVHYGFGAVVQVTAAQLDRPGAQKIFDRYQLIRWAAPVSAVIFVALFCFSSEAVKEYKRVCQSVKGKVLPKKEPLSNRRPIEILPSHLESRKTFDSSASLKSPVATDDGQGSTFGLGISSINYFNGPGTRESFKAEAEAIEMKVTVDRRVD